MSKIYANPFNWGEPVSGSQYIQRPDELQHVLSILEKPSHLILSGYRGTGKTSFIKNLVEKASQPSVYLDLRFIVSREGLINLLLDALEQSFPIAKAEGRISPLRSAAHELELSSIFDVWFELVKKSNKKFITVWDEFQHLVKLKENVADELKEGLKHRRGFSHIFISHRSDVLHEVFNDKKNPIFNNQEFYELKNLEAKACSKFLSQRFRRMGLSDFDLPDAVYGYTKGQPQLTLKVAHALAQLWLEGTTTRLLARTIPKLLTEHNALFTAMWDGFGVNEKRLLLGLASGYSHPTELGFIKKFGLSATSTAHNTVSKLVREGWLANQDEGYYIYDPLFLNWLEKREGLL